MVLRIVANLFDKSNIIESKDIEFFEDFFPMKLIIEISRPHVKGFNDPLNSGRRYDIPPMMRRWFGNPPKIGGCFDIPLESSKQELRRSKRKRVVACYGDDLSFLLRMTLKVIKKLYHCLMLYFGGKQLIMKLT